MATYPPFGVGTTALSGGPEVERLGISLGVFTAVAVGALGGSLYLLFTNPEMAAPGAADSAFAVEPWWDGDGAGLRLNGRF